MTPPADHSASDGPRGQDGLHKTDQDPSLLLREKVVEAIFGRLRQALYYAPNSITTFVLDKAALPDTCEEIADAILALLSPDEPFYIRQCGDEMTDEEARHWFHQAAQEAVEEGATFARYSYHPDIPHLRIVEAWKERPDDQGEIRWALTGSGSTSVAAQVAQPIREAPPPPPDVSNPIGGKT